MRKTEAAVQEKPAVVQQGLGAVALVLFISRLFGKVEE
ncbi:hypothetical protein WELLINGTON_174 [Erwinia phage Wellington]|uniref:Uncharacterized protein n=2 Tax=Wellingtonvirus wellington TaxID=2734153 RepID=A0A1B2IE14_9CAUD|nr:hypothetical protein BIZ80_gp124 [Erwinia phage vB_EamM_Kwan]YP_009806658.1 hypothetical protein HOT70_gp127 [Erwinia phage Wellington]ANZ49527.1 hypothetical protein KWAN_175 [Erwinia phage vB_EamM_Kwan]AXF51303.1 hypothetical protein WELLINGTON_174 [Erwinia phage Wellington]